MQVNEKQNKQKIYNKLMKARTGAFKAQWNKIKYNMLKKNPGLLGRESPGSYTWCE